jgi:putative iron-dependent peroxidase
MFALGTPSHAYLEFDAHEGAGPRLVTAIASLREPRTTMGGVNLVTGFRPDLWRVVAADDAPPGLQGFDADVVGAEGYRMPATQHEETGIVL